MVRRDVAVLARRSRRAGATPGSPIRPPCAPGPIAGCIVTWWPGDIEAEFHSLISPPCRLPAAEPGIRCRRQPPDQEPEGAGRPRGVLRGPRRLGQALDQLASQLAVQVLPDGGHYERAPAYHCQVLADLVDVAELVRCTGQAPAPELLDAIDRMRYWLRCVRAQDGQVPLLNDGYPVDPELIAALRPGLPPAEPLLVLSDTGLVRAAAGRWRLLADVGAPCPEELPAHAHADTLSCLVQVEASRCWWTRARPPTRRARSAATRGPPRRTTRSKWTAPTRPRCGARSGPPGGPRSLSWRPASRTAGC